MKLFDIVRLTEAVESRWTSVETGEERIVRHDPGAIGAIVEVHDAGAAFEVEFDDDVATVLADHLELVESDTSNMSNEEFRAVLDAVRGPPLIELDIPPECIEPKSSHGWAEADPKCIYGYRASYARMWLSPSNNFFDWYMQTFGGCPFFDIVPTVEMEGQMVSITGAKIIFDDPEKAAIYKLRWL